MKALMEEERRAMRAAAAVAADTVEEPLRAHHMAWAQSWIADAREFEVAVASPERRRYIEHAAASSPLRVLALLDERDRLAAELAADRAVVRELVAALPTLVHQRILDDSSAWRRMLDRMARWDAPAPPSSTAP